MKGLFLLFFAIQGSFLYLLWIMVKANEARLERLESAKPVPIIKAPMPVVAQQTRQVYEKPVVPGAKTVTSLEIGAGRLSFDEDNQVAEWV